MRGHDLGGRIGEGVIAGTGLLPEVIQDTVARIHAGAREAGRDPAGVDVWFAMLVLAPVGAAALLQFLVGFYAGLLALPAFAAPKKKVVAPVPATT